MLATNLIFVSIIPAWINLARKVYLSRERNLNLIQKREVMQKNKRIKVYNLDGYSIIKPKSHTRMSILINKKEKGKSFSIVSFCKERFSKSKHSVENSAFLFLFCINKCLFMFMRKKNNRSPIDLSVFQINFVFLLYIQIKLVNI